MLCYFHSSLILQPLKIHKPLTIVCSTQPKPPPRKRPNVDGQRPAFGNRKNYGASRRSIQKTLKQEQVTFTSPIPDDPIVGIIGGDMAGLACAIYLEKRGVRSTVFDTGVHGLGGRMGTRIVDPQPLIFDHAAQFFTASDPQFAGLVQGWLEQGLVLEWQGTIGELEVGGHFVPLPSSPPRYTGVNGMRPIADSVLSQAHKYAPIKLEVGGHFVPLPSSPPRYTGVNGMRPIADSVLSQTRMINVERPCWISKLELFNGMWHLSENGKPCGKFDAIVIAHNAFEDPLQTPGEGAFPFEGAFVKGVDSISWMANNTKKLQGSHSNGPHCWTFLSSAAYAKRNKVPQENIANATAEKVKAGMLLGVEEALGLPKGSLQKPFYTRIQLWGAALPTNTPGIPCIFDPLGRAGICGDWLLGSNLESAALSGISLANHMADYFQSSGGRPEEFAVGFRNEFQPLRGHDIGQFPGLVSQTQTRMPTQESYQLTT